MKSKNSSFNQDNYEYKRCPRKQGKMHKLYTKLSERVSKGFNLKDFERSKSMQTFHKHEFKFKLKSDRKCRSWDAKCKYCAKCTKCAKSA